MTGIGTIVNSAAIIAGGAAGLLLKKGCPESMKSTIMQALGLSVLVIGISGVLQGLYKITGSSIDRQYIFIMIISLVIGAVAGELLNVEGSLEKAGNWLERKISFGGGNFTEGFVTTSLVYCVGAMAIIGSLEDGLSGKPDTLFAKAILDGVSAVIFSATMGIGVLFSSIPVFLYQGAITILAGTIKPFLTPEIISQISVIGSVLIMGIGFNILGFAKIKVGNLLPSVLVPFAYYAIMRVIG